MQMPAQRYTIILIPLPASVADSAGDRRGSEEAIPPGRSKDDSQANSGNFSEPHLHPVELLIER